jgi:hypothetical protein
MEAFILHDASPYAIQQYLSKSDEDATKPLRSELEKLLAVMDAMRPSLTPFRRIVRAKAAPSA